MPPHTSGSTNASSTLTGFDSVASECTTDTPQIPKLRHGAQVQIKCRTTQGWVPGQVVAPEEDGKVVVEFAVNGRAHRKSVKSVSPDLWKDAESCPLSLRRPTSAQEPMEREAFLQLVELQAREERLAVVQPVPERSTAAMKWAHARKIADAGLSLELWCSGLENLKGKYFLARAEGAEQGPPVYQQEASGHKWLFLASNGAWWLGSDDDKDRRKSRGYMRSDPLEPGTLPHVVERWEVPTASEWAPQPSARFWLSESVDVAWQKLTVAAFQVPVVEIRGVADISVNGLYDFMPGDSNPGEPPSYQHQQIPDRWLYFARDQRWWVSEGSAKDAREERGRVHSACVQPGTHPAEASGWHVLRKSKSAREWDECKALTIRRVPGAVTACEKWRRSGSRVQNVEIWGKGKYHGEYEQREPVDGAPTYQSAADPCVWLYLASDGAWWLSTQERRNCRDPEGSMKSDAVEPGTLPQDVDAWKDMKRGSWEVNPMIRVLLPEVVGDEWSLAWEAVAESQVIEVQGVEGPRFNGMYDLLLDKGSTRKPPVFQHQINQDLYMYVAKDGRWWVSSKTSMRDRAPSGRMHSELILPGMLPTHTALTWHVVHGTNKEWELQKGVIIS